MTSIDCGFISAIDYIGFQNDSYEKWFQFRKSHYDLLIHSIERVARVLFFVLLRSKKLPSKSIHEIDGIENFSFFFCFRSNWLIKSCYEPQSAQLTVVNVFLRPRCRRHGNARRRNRPVVVVDWIRFHFNSIIEKKRWATFFLSSFSLCVCVCVCVCGGRGRNWQDGLGNYSLIIFRSCRSFA